jgi:hypothetical protein
MTASQFAAHARVKVLALNRSVHMPLAHGFEAQTWMLSSQFLRVNLAGQVQKWEPSGLVLHVPKLPW